jgi:hypothetical protein
MVGEWYPDFPGCVFRDVMSGLLGEIIANVMDDV